MGRRRIRIETDRREVRPPDCESIRDPSIGSPFGLGQFVCWKQIGEDIKGEAADDDLGFRSGS